MCRGLMPCDVSAPPKIKLLTSYSTQQTTTIVIMGVKRFIVA